MAWKDLLKSAEEFAGGISYWTTMGTPFQKKPQPPQEVIEKPPQRPIDRVMHATEHHSTRVVNASLKLALLRTNPVLDQNPQLMVSAALLQRLLELHAGQLLSEKLLSPPTVEKLTGAGPSIVEAIGLMATSRIVNCLGPDEIISMLNDGASPGQIAEAGIATIAHTDYAKPIINRFLEQMEKK